METDSNSKKAAIIEAAGAIFVENGFRTTTVRQICMRADVNVAAINYYFGDKKKLYMEVLRYYREVAFKKFPPGLGVKEDDPPRQKIKSFIHSMIMGMFEEGSATWFGKLLAREFVEPTGALDTLMEEVIRPSFIILASIVREILGERATDETVYLCTMSILGQCLYFRNSPSIISRVLRREKFNRQEIIALAEHISHFSLSALENYIREEADLPQEI
jgi:TetR/AcrR family transcriptional regulator, regulator of cefoperazone and chloramphenicol sensitivity